MIGKTERERERGEGETAVGENQEEDVYCRINRWQKELLQRWRRKRISLLLSEREKRKRKRERGEELGDGDYDDDDDGSTTTTTNGSDGRGELRNTHSTLIRTYRGYEGRVEGVLGKSEEDACFADARVPDQQQLEQIIVRLGHPLARALRAGCCWLLASPSSLSRGLARGRYHTYTRGGLGDSMSCGTAFVVQRRSQTAAC